MLSSPDFSPLPVSIPLEVKLGAAFARQALYTELFPALNYFEANPQYIISSVPSMWPIYKHCAILSHRSAETLVFDPVCTRFPINPYNLF